MNPNDDSDEFTLRPSTIELTSAWDERKRTFDRLRLLTLNDNDRKQALTEYKTAVEVFAKARRDALK